MWFSSLLECFQQQWTILIQTILFSLQKFKCNIDSFFHYFWMIIIAYTTIKIKWDVIKANTI